MHDFERYDILPCMRVPRSTTDTSYPVRDIIPHAHEYEYEPVLVVYINVTRVDIGQC